jgi:outer membrane receptor for ferrienterochelin and colicins
LINAGLTIQSAQYDEEETIWSPEEVTDANADSIVATDQILRTPELYGYLSLTYRPTQRWSLTYSAVYTGSMEAAHVIDPETEYTIIEETPHAGYIYGPNRPRTVFFGVKWGMN